MRIAVVGAGSMGSLYGGILAEDGHDVVFVDMFREHMDTIAAKGLTIRKEESVRVISGIQAVTDSKAIQPVDLLLVFVKSTVTESALAEHLTLIDEGTTVLTLQNGLGNIEKIEQFVDRSQIIAGTSANGANLLQPGEIQHAGWGGTTIGELDGQCTPRIQKLAALLGTGELGPVQISDNVVGLIWDKLMANIGINALSALTRLRNGELLDHAELVRKMNTLVNEAVLVAETKGICLGYDDSASHCREIALATAGNISSMLADVLHRRKTEIESINGAIVEEGKRLGIATPMNEMVTILVQALEKTNL